MEKKLTFESSPCHRHPRRSQARTSLADPMSGAQTVTRDWLPRLKARFPGNAFRLQLLHHPMKRDTVMKPVLVILLCSLLSACVGDMAVRIQVPDAPSGQALAQVKVNDLRAPGVAASKREAAFGVPMGNVTLNPPEVQLVKQLLEVELTRRLREKGVRTPRDYVCEIMEFGVNTSTTPLYWDVVGRVRLVLKDGAKDYPLSGTQTERTYGWPGETIVTRVVEESLRQIAAELGPAAEGR